MNLALKIYEAKLGPDEMQVAVTRRWDCVRGRPSGQGRAEDSFQRALKIKEGSCGPVETD